MKTPGLPSTVSNPIGVTLVLALLGACTEDSNAKRAKPQGPMSVLQARLGELDRCGIRLREAVAAQELLEGFDAAAAVRDQLMHLLVALGEVRDRARPFLSEQVAVLHVEDLRRADGHFLAATVRRLAQGDLPLTGIDQERKEGKSYVRFTLREKQYRWPLVGTRGEFAQNLLKRLGDLLRGSGRRLGWIPAGTGVWIVVCPTPEQRAELKALGLDVKLLA